MYLTRAVAPLACIYAVVRFEKEEIARSLSRRAAPRRATPSGAEPVRHTDRSLR